MSCGSRLSYESEIAWTWQDGRLLAFCLCFVGLTGAFLNCLVLIGVGGNARLGTTVNKLLSWICIMALLESTLGITVKSLILGMKKSGAKGIWFLFCYFQLKLCKQTWVNRWIWSFANLSFPCHLYFAIRFWFFGLSFLFIDFILSEKQVISIYYKISICFKNHFKKFQQIEELPKQDEDSPQEPRKFHKKLFKIPTARHL